jgi:hypothetical protein
MLVSRAGSPRPSRPARSSSGGLAMPAEGNFPVLIVAAHGLLAVSTLVLAILTAVVTVPPR